jgi:RimJ/RimL family protein N-acetyltransferase
MRRLAERSTKLAAEVRGGEVRGPGERVHVERLAVAGVDQILRAQEMPHRVDERHPTSIARERRLVGLHAESEQRTAVRLEAWGTDDLPLLEKLMGDPAMTEHLGGPESPEKIAERQARYESVEDTGKGRMFKIVVEATGEAAGSVGYWEREWLGQQVYETGWSVLPAFQGRGIAGAATALVIEEARAEKRHRFLHAFPSVDNAPSNAICRKLGFTLLDAHEFEYPPGNFMRCNDWRLDLLELG